MVLSTGTYTEPRCCIHVYYLISGPLQSSHSKLQYVSSLSWVSGNWVTGHLLAEGSDSEREVWQASHVLIGSLKPYVLELC